jgi:hypothetical protein
LRGVTIGLTGIGRLGFGCEICGQGGLMLTRALIRSRGFPWFLWRLIM